MSEMLVMPIGLRTLVHRLKCTFCVDETGGYMRLWTYLS